MECYVKKINEKGNIAIEDNILVKGIEMTAGSHILEGFKALFSAEAISRLEDKGYSISGKTHVGEFGLDLVGEFSHYAMSQENLKGAAASLVEDGKAKVALGVDVNGSPRRAAAISNVDFLKPTYGIVSRYGIVSTAASGEQIGVYAKNVKDIQETMNIIAGHDEKDGTSLPDKKYDFSTDINITGKRVCIVKELLEKTDDQTKKYIENLKNELISKGVIVEEISMDLFEIANVAWQILMCAETCNNLSRYDGVKFGYRTKEYKDIDELYVNSRTEGFNFLTKAIILYGSNVLSKERYKNCYEKALKIRRVVDEEFEKIMKEYDAIITPVCSKTQYEKYDISLAFEKVFKESEFTSIANLIGAPALVSGKVQFIGRKFDESTLLSLVNSVEREG